MLKKLAVGVAAVGLGMSLAASALAQNIIIVSHGQANDPFWSIVKNGASAAASNYGVRVDYRAPETFDMVQMAQLISAAVTQEPDGLIVSMPDADALGPAVRRAVSAGIPVITMNSGSDVSAELGAVSHVGQEERVAGLYAGRFLKSQGGKKGLCVNHEVGNVALDLRCEGFAEGFGGSVSVLPTGNDPSEVKAKVKAALRSDSSIDTVLTLGASLAGEPSVEAIEELGRTGRVRLGSFDLSPGLMDAVLAGKAEFGIDQQPYLQGYLPVAFLTLNHRFGVMPVGQIGSGPNLITADKAAQVKDLSAKGIR